VNVQLAWLSMTLIQLAKTLICLISRAYISKMGYETNLITHYIIWSQRAELNRRPTDYKSDNIEII